MSSIHAGSIASFNEKYKKVSTELEAVSSAFQNAIRDAQTNIDTTAQIGDSLNALVQEFSTNSLSKLETDASFYPSSKRVAEFRLKNYQDDSDFVQPIMRKDVSLSYDIEKILQPTTTFGESTVEILENLNTCNSHIEKLVKTLSNLDIYISRINQKFLNECAVFKIPDPSSDTPQYGDSTLTLFVAYNSIRNLTSTSFQKAMDNYKKIFTSPAINNTSIYQPKRLHECGLNIDTGFSPSIANTFLVSNFNIVKKDIIEFEAKCILDDIVFIKTIKAHLVAVFSEVSSNISDVDENDIINELKNIFININQFFIADSSRVSSEPSEFEGCGKNKKNKSGKKNKIKCIPSPSKMHRLVSNVIPADTREYINFPKPPVSRACKRLRGGARKKSTTKSKKIKKEVLDEEDEFLIEPDDSNSDSNSDSDTDSNTQEKNVLPPYVDIKFLNKLFKPFAQILSMGARGYMAGIDFGFFSMGYDFEFMDDFKLPELQDFLTKIDSFSKFWPLLSDLFSKPEINTINKKCLIDECENIAKTTFVVIEAVRMSKLVGQTNVDGSECTLKKMIKENSSALFPMYFSSREAAVLSQYLSKFYNDPTLEMSSFSIDYIKDIFLLQPHIQILMLYIYGFFINYLFTKSDDEGTVDQLVNLTNLESVIMPSLEFLLARDTGLSFRDYTDTTSFKVDNIYRYILQNIISMSGGSYGSELDNDSRILIVSYILNTILDFIYRVATVNKTVSQFGHRSEQYVNLMKQHNRNEIQNIQDFEGFMGPYIRSAKLIENTMFIQLFNYNALSFENEALLNAKINIRNLASFCINTKTSTDIMTSACANYNAIIKNIFIFVFLAYRSKLGNVDTNEVIFGKGGCSCSGVEKPPAAELVIDYFNNNGKAKGLKEKKGLVFEENGDNKYSPDVKFLMEIPSLKGIIEYFKQVQHKDFYAVDSVKAIDAPFSAFSNDLSPQSRQHNSKVESDSSNEFFKIYAAYRIFEKGVSTLATQNKLVAMKYFEILNFVEDLKFFFLIENIALQHFYHCPYAYIFNEDVVMFAHLTRFMGKDSMNKLCSLYINITEFANALCDEKTYQDFFQKNNSLKRLREYIISFSYKPDSNGNIINPKYIHMFRPQPIARNCQHFYLGILCAFLAHSVHMSINSKNQVATKLLC